MGWYEGTQGVTANHISLLLGHPDPTTLDTPAFQDAVRRVMSSPRAYQALEYGNEQGNIPLIEYLVARINREQSLSLNVDNLMVVAGSTHAVDMIGRLYAKPSGVVIVEAPTYIDALQIFRDHGAELYAVPVDQDGVVVEAFEQLLKRLSAAGKLPQLFYTIPTFHNPTGITTSVQRRLDVIRLARQYDFTIVEDDVYRDLAFDIDITPSYFGLANGVNVIQIGSFSKTLAPGLRLGWMVASAEIVRQCVQCGTTQMGGGANPFVAQIVAEYCQQGYWDEHVEYLKNLYRMRRDTLLDALIRYLPPEISWTKPAGGFFVWLTLPEKFHAPALKEAALKRGLMVASGTGYFVNPDDGEHHIRLTYSYASPEDLEKAAHILAELISD